MINNIILDVDGSLTDGTITVNDLGVESKKFSILDGMAIKSANSKRINIIILSGRKSKATEYRLRELGINEIYQGIENKKDFLNAYYTKKKLLFNETLYFGDDINDYDSMLLCKFRACPSNANDIIKKISHYICNSKGGLGAFREAYDFYFYERTI